MSTDYGLRCVDCDSNRVQENLGRYAIEDILKAVPALARLKQAAIEASVGVLDIELSCYCVPYMFNDFLDWVVEHHEHKLVMVDEYGDEYIPKPK